ncbi:MAG: DUF1540 domain-containing protein [Oscillospiraceae bacterium]|nr:DUF1540 domain-containing protein [Oscillospiraceae bacterium]
MSNEPNTNVNCTVGQCQYHSVGNFCSLDSISIGTHESDPSQPECVDCNSFRKQSIQ